MMMMVKMMMMMIKIRHTMAHLFDNYNLYRFRFKQVNQDIIAFFILPIKKSFYKSFNAIFGKIYRSLCIG